MLRFVAALDEGDLESAGKLVSASRASLRDDYQVSIPELDLLVRLAESAGAFGARLLGGGFGGSVLALTDVERATELAAGVVRDYRSESGRDGRAFVVHPSAGAAIRPPSTPRG